MAEVSDKVAAALGSTGKAIPSAIVLPKTFETKRRDSFPYAAAWLFVSDPKVGKSTLVEHLSKAYVALGKKPILHIDTENGASEISGCVVRAGSLDEIDRILAMLNSGGIEDYSGVAIDTADAVEKFCQELTCEELQIRSMGDHGHGAEWSRSTNHTMQRFSKFRRFETVGKCLILTSHAKTEERDKIKITKPCLTGQTGINTCGLVDSVGYIYRQRFSPPKKQGVVITDLYERFLTFSGHSALCAGSRFDRLRNREFQLAHLEVNPDANLFSPILDVYANSNNKENDSK